jgi:polysaccharide pyruvyl transferase WcaK-like protein/glycosyltransferase involved in cell wall biosynthesis
VHGVAAVDFFDTGAVEDVIQESDMVVMGGGGLFQEFPDIEYYKTRISSLFSNPYGKLMGFSVVPILAAVYRKPLFFIGHGVGPFHSEEAQSFYRFIFSLPTIITVRDRYSLSWTAQLGRKEDAHLSADPAFLMRAEEEEKVTRILRENNLTEKEFITLSLRDWVYNELVQKTVREAAHALNAFLKDRDLKVLCIPFQETRKEGHPTQDSAIALQMIHKIDKELRGRVILLKESLKPREVLALVGKGLFGVGMRYHFLIFSFLNSIPAISLSYDEKCVHLMEEMGLRDLSVNILDIAPGTLLKALSRVSHKIDMYSSIVTERLPHMKELALRSFTLLRGDDAGKIIERADEKVEPEKIDILQEMRKTLLYKDERIKDLDGLVQETTKKTEHLQQELSREGKRIKDLDGLVQETTKKTEHLQQELSREGKRIEELSLNVARQNSIIEEKEKTARELDARLSQTWNTLNGVYNSKTWKIGQLYGRLFGMESPWRKKLLKRFLKRQYDTNSFDPGSNVSGQSEANMVAGGIHQLKEFIYTHGNKEEMYVVFCAAPFLNHAGQRGVRFAQELSLIKKPVVFIACLQDHVRDEVKIIDDNIISYPLNWFYAVSQEIISSPLLRERKKVMIFQISFFSAFEMISLANAHGWITVYDIVDDWEGFYSEDFITEYDRETEHYLASNSDVLVAVNQSLRDKFTSFGEVHLISNGYSPRLLQDGNEKKLKRGTITAGFFGHLHKARFNWDLLTATAEKNKDWVFHIIGFDHPQGLSVPENIILHGPVDPSELAGYARNWDVALIPYQYNELCRHLNPIKIFEYLYLGLPIVATGCEDAQNYPYTFYAREKNEFAPLIQKAAATSVEKEKISGFLLEATWENRLSQLLNAIETGKAIKALYTG